MIILNLFKIFNSDMKLTNHGAPSGTAGLGWAFWNDFGL
jgi:hypothetical protein